MLKKTRSGSNGGAKVTFVLPSQPNANHVHVVGDFNDWRASTPMKQQKDGSWRASVELQPGDYQFRYLVDGNVWVNDEAADEYRMGPFGADNCVVRIAAGGHPGEAPGALAGRGSRPSAGGSAGGKSSSGAKGEGGKSGAGRSKAAGASTRRKGGPEGK